MENRRFLSNLNTTLMQTPSEYQKKYMFRSHYNVRGVHTSLTCISFFFYHFSSKQFMTMQDSFGMREREIKRERK